MITFLERNWSHNTHWVSHKDGEFNAVTPLVITLRRIMSQMWLSQTLLKVTMARRLCGYLRNESCFCALA